MSPFTILKHCPSCQTVQECDYVTREQTLGYEITAIRCRKCKLIIQHAERLEE